MGFLDQLIGRLGGHEPIERFAHGQANFDDPQSPDFEQWNQLVGAAPPEYMHEAMTRAAQQVEPQEYYEHITPGGAWNQPLGRAGRGRARTARQSFTGGPHRQQRRRDAPAAGTGARAAHDRPAADEPARGGQHGQLYAAISPGGIWSRRRRTRAAGTWAPPAIARE